MPSDPLGRTEGKPAGGGGEHQSLAPLVDTHCHLAFDAFEADRGAVLDRARAAGVVGCVVVAVDAGSADDATRLSLAHPGLLHPTAGVHPNDPKAGDPEEFARIAERLAGGGFVAVGETGLDAFHRDVELSLQVASLERHLALALELDLPVVLHCRDAFPLLFEVLAGFGGAPLRGVLHCFTGGQAEADALVARGLHLGFGGITTYKPREDLRAIARRVPTARLLLETDAPFLAPQPVRGARNEPAFVAYVADCLALERGIAREELARTTTENAVRLFGLPPPTPRPGGP